MKLLLTLNIYRKMNKLIFIALIALLPITSLAQKKNLITNKGELVPMEKYDSAANKAIIDLKLNKTDTTGKWANRVIVRNDSAFYVKGSTEFFIVKFISPPAQFNPIAGTNIGITGTYPNITIGVAGTISAINGGTGQAGTSPGDLLYGSGSVGLYNRLSIGADGKALRVVGGVPAWVDTVAYQLPITNPVTGLGTLNFLSKWTPNSSTVGSSSIWDDGTNVGISTTAPVAKLNVHGSSLARALAITSTISGTNRYKADIDTFGVFTSYGSNYIDASNYSRGVFGINGNEFIMKTEAAGTGTMKDISITSGTNRALYFGTNGTSYKAYLTVGGTFAVATNGTSSVSAINTNGSWNRSTGSASAQVLIQESGATAFSGSAAGTGVAINAASGFGGNLIHGQLNGVHRFSVDGGGNANFSTSVTGGSTTISGNQISFGNSAGVIALSGTQIQVGTGIATTSTVFPNGAIGIGSLTAPSEKFRIGSTGLLKFLSIGSLATGPYVEKGYFDSAGTYNGFNISGQLRSRIGGFTSFGQSISTRDGEFAVGLIDASQGAAIRMLTLGTGFTYLDGYTEGASKASNYDLIIGSRVNNTGAAITNSTTAETGTNVQIGFQAATKPSSILSLNTTTRGFLLPRLTNTQMLAIASPATGLLVFNTDSATMHGYNGSNWQKYLTANAAGNVGIGTTSPLSRLHIAATAAAGGSLVVGTAPVSLGSQAATISAANTTNQALILYGQASQTQNIFEVRKSDDAAQFAVGQTGGTMSGAWSVGGGGSLTLSSGGTGNDMLRLNNVATNGKSYYVGSQSNGNFVVRSNTLSADRLVIDSAGNVGIGTSSPTKLLQIGTTNPVISLKQSTTNQDYQMRVGLGTGLSSQKWDLYDASAAKTIIAAQYSGGGARVSIGSTTPYASSTLYVGGGGSAGANIDAQANGTSSQESNIECMAIDYATGKGIAMRLWSDSLVTGSTVLGNAKQHLALLDFNEDLNIIRTNNTNPLIFGINNTERARLDNAGTLSLATVKTTPVTFASLPAGSLGMIATISDSNTNTWGATIAGGGGNNVVGFFNGTVWTVLGK